jgi:uncharacterized C2H2 Zn-finger protein
MNGTAKMPTTDYRNTSAARKHHRSIFEHQGNEQTRKRRRTEKVIRAEDFIPFFTRELQNLQERVSLLEKGKSSKSATEEPEEPEELEEPGELRESGESGKLGRVIFLCPLCTEDFTRTDNLARHLEKKHQFKCNNYCKICKRQFGALEAFARHSKGHYPGSVWENIVNQGSHGSGPGLPSQLPSQPCKDINATLLLQPFSDTLDEAPSNSLGEQITQCFSHDVLDIFSAAPFDLFSAAPFDPPGAFDMFSAAPSDPPVETTHQPLLGDRAANNTIPAGLALSSNDEEAFIKDITRGLLRNSASDPSIIDQLLTLSGGAKASE